MKQKLSFFFLFSSDFVQTVQSCGSAVLDVKLGSDEQEKSIDPIGLVFAVDCLVLSFGLKTGMPVLWGVNGNDSYSGDSQYNASVFVYYF